jgi:hypothetical protein
MTALYSATGTGLSLALCFAMIVTATGLWGMMKGELG